MMIRLALIAFLLSFLVACASSPTKTAVEQQTPYHFKAVQVVMETQLDFIRALDEGDWQNDLETRMWKAKRFRFPGVEYNKNLFIVTYHVADKNIAAWVVDIENKTAASEKNRNE